MKQLVALTAIAATLALTACSGDVSADDLRDSFIDQGLSEETATCITDYLEENLSDDEFQTAVKTADVDQLSDEAVGVVTAAWVVCTGS